MTVCELKTFAGIAHGGLSQTGRAGEEGVPLAEVLERLGLQRVGAAGVLRPNVTRQHEVRVPPRDELPGQVRPHRRAHRDLDLVGRPPTPRHEPRHGCAARDGVRHADEVLSEPTYRALGSAGDGVERHGWRRTSHAAPASAAGRRASGRAASDSHRGRRTGGGACVRPRGPAASGSRSPRRWWSLASGHLDVRSLLPLLRLLLRRVL